MVENDKRVKLYVKNTKEAFYIANLVKNYLLAKNITIDENNYNIAISIGGDGTFLKMLHKNKFNNKISYAAINAGSLGFLSSVESNNFEKFIDYLLDNKLSVKNIKLLKVKIYANNTVSELYCINELTIRNDDFSTLKAKVFINNKLLEDYRGDGLIISTTTGSTGYIQSFNGPIIDNDLNALLITPIAPINNQVYKSLISSLVLSSNKLITIVPYDNSNFCYLTDGMITRINNCEKIECIEEASIKYYVSDEYDYITMLKSKIISDNN